MVYEADHGVVGSWSDALRVGNPVRSSLVTQNINFSREKQSKVRVTVKQAPVLLHSHSQAISGPMRRRLRISPDPFERAVLARDIALFTMVFNTTKRGDELTRTLIQRILRLPNHSGLLFNLQWGKTMRCGADHLISVA